MKTSLFADDSAGESLSPKLAWLKKHGLVTSYYPEYVGGGESPETGEEYFPWLCGKDGGDLSCKNTGGGHSEEDAIFNYCEKTGTPHYSLE